MILGTLSWIADELIGIKTIERRLSKCLVSKTPPDSRLLVNRIQYLNLRVTLLDRVLDDYTGGSKPSFRSHR